MGKYFGTDGIRGVANTELSPLLAFKAGQAAALVIGQNIGKRPSILIGKDTRISSDVIEAALCAGICSTGADVVLLGVVPTPAVAFLTCEYKADAGVVISASHNPFEYNGIKIFNNMGYKLNDELETRIEQIIDSGANEEDLPSGADIGHIVHGESGALEKYINHLVSTAECSLDGLKIAVDCANGAAGTTAARLFAKLNADVDIKFAAPDGTNINTNCGSTHLENLKQRVVNGGFDVGIAFDGDADRCLAVDELGNEIDGDRIIAVCAEHLKKQNCLSKNTIVATILSNLGLHAFAKERGMTVETCAVGDRFVLEKMLEGGFDIGGEQSGHIIFRQFATTGDGQLTAIRFLSVLKQSGEKCSQLVSCMEKYPQVSINCAVPNKIKKQVVQDERVQKAVKQAETEFGGDGRVVIRPSGTEAIVRVMTEGKNIDSVRRIAQSVADVISICIE